MAKAKTKPRGANKYTPPKKSGAPGWIWLVAGIVIGGFIMFLMKLEPKQDIRNGQKPTTTATRPKDNNTNNKPEFKFEFDKMLSGKEPNQPIITEEQRKKLDGDRAAALLEGRTPPVVPPTTPVKPPVQPTQQVNQPIQTTQPSQVAVVTPPTPPSNMNFFLQAGSYPTQTGAESIRAQILMLGQDVKVETANSNNKTWYRVLVGPFKTKDDATKAQKQLSSHGFNQTLVVPRKVQ